MHHPPFPLRLIPGAGLVALLLVVAACGDDSNDEGDQAQAAEEQTMAEEEPADAQTAAEEEAPAAEEQPEADEQAEEEPDLPALPPDQLAYGGTISGSVLSADEPAQFRFEGTAGDLVRVRVDGKTPMDPIVTLLEPNRTEILTNDDLSIANRDSVIIATLPSSGLQVVRIAAFDDASGGDFVLSVELLEPEIVDESATIAIGDTVQARLHTPDDIDTFEFTGQAGQLVRIRADGAVGVDTYIELFDPAGNFIAGGAGDDSGHGLDAELEIALPDSGSYRVNIYPAIVGRPAGERLKIGEYTLSITIRPDTVLASGETATALASLALTYLDAIRQGDVLTIFGLSGPEQIDQFDWESADDIPRDLSDLQDVDTGGVAGEATAEIEGDRARISLVVEGTAATLRFDAINVNGQWLVDFIQRIDEAPPWTADESADEPEA